MKRTACKTWKRSHNLTDLAFPRGEPTPIIALWILRILLPLGGLRSFTRPSGIFNVDVAEAVGLPSLDDPNLSGAALHEKMRTELADRYRQMEEESICIALPATLERNLERLGQLIGLDASEQMIFGFVVLLQTEWLLEKAADSLGRMTMGRASRALSVILGLPRSRIERALDPRSTLIRSSLIRTRSHQPGTLGALLYSLSFEFADRMVSAEADPLVLLHDMVNVANRPQLDLSHYDHVRSNVKLVLKWLGRAVASRTRGVNVFIYGAPGTGKTQLTRAIAKELNCQLLEVSTEARNGEPTGAMGRLSAFRAAQCFFARSRALVVFDEAEDVFSRIGVNAESVAQQHKGWINRILEENEIPSVWLSNTVRGLDPAFVRRFDLIFELPIPPHKQRVGILQDCAGGWLEESTLASIAQSEVLAPAVVQRAASIIRGLGDQLEPDERSEVYGQLINNTLRAQGHRQVPRGERDQTSDTYDPHLMRVSADLKTLASGLEIGASARICLYGPPGTGKTAWAHALAEHLEAPLFAKRASNLLSMWVGSNEKNIANAFEQAESDGAILLIDEIDSFLRQRRDADRHWEVTLVNELLSQIEAFSGIFIATTNRLDALDAAAMRRFDLKIRFGYLSDDQVRRWMQRCCSILGLPSPSAGALGRLIRLRHLAPGDFAAIMRQHRFCPFTSAVAVIDALEIECNLKQDARPQIGFMG